MVSGNRLETRMTKMPFLLKDIFVNSLCMGMASSAATTRIIVSHKRNCLAKQSTQTKIFVTREEQFSYIFQVSIQTELTVC